MPIALVLSLSTVTQCCSLTLKFINKSDFALNLLFVDHVQFDFDREDNLLASISKDDGQQTVYDVEISDELVNPDNPQILCLKAQPLGQRTEAMEKIDPVKFDCVLAKIIPFKDGVITLRGRYYGGDFDFGSVTAILEITSDLPGVEPINLEWHS